MEGMNMGMGGASTGTTLTMPTTSMTMQDGMTMVVSAGTVYLTAGSSPTGMPMLPMGGMSMSSPMGMGMATTFSWSTEVTLLFDGWTTNTPGKYFGTLLFVFLITIFNRFLGAWRSQLGRKWADKAAHAIRKHAEKQEKQKRLKHRIGHSQHRKSLSFGNKDAFELDNLDELDPLASPTNTLVNDDEERSSSDSHARSSDCEQSMSPLQLEQATLAPRWTRWSGNRWKASNPWKVWIDVPKALMEGLRAFVGYLLMLAVMTFNVGLFASVVLGVVVGELAFGRFTNGGEGGGGDCEGHD